MNTIVPMKSKMERLNDYFGDIKWLDFNQHDVDNYIDHARNLTRWKRGKAGLSDGTIKKDLTILRASLYHGANYGEVPMKKAIKIDNLESENRSDWLDEAMMKRVIACCDINPDRDHIYAFLIIALATGARREAIFQLTWDQVYIPPQVLKLEEIEPKIQPDGSMPKKAYRREVIENLTLDWKTGKPIEGAYIDFGAKHGNKRRPRISIGENDRLIRYLAFEADRSQPYVISYRGKAIKDIKKGLQAVGEEAGLTFKLTHHVMKKTCITWLVRKGIPFEAIEAMTNTSVATLKKHYSQHSPDLAKMIGGTFNF